MRTATIILLCSVPIHSGCASTPGAKPHDMSVEQHEAMAAEQDRASAAHAAQYDPSATVEKRRCGPSGLKSPETCWTTTENPTEAHAREAEKHRKMAADHRAGSQALRDAEAQACAGLSDDDRDMSPFMHREDIARVEELDVANPNDKRATHKRGALVFFRAVPGMTAQWLQRLVDCHIARASAMGHEMPEMPYCPLVPKGVSATVSPTASGFAVAIQAEDHDGAQEVLRRAKLLVTP